MRLTLPEIKRKISKLIPEDIESEVTLEAGSISIITKQPGRFTGGSESPVSYTHLTLPTIYSV